MYVAVNSVGCVYDLWLVDRSESSDNGGGKLLGLGNARERE